jgi:hypothetical protein
MEVFKAHNAVNSGEMALEDFGSIVDNCEAIKNYVKEYIKEYEPAREVRETQREYILLDAIDALKHIYYGDLGSTSFNKSAYFRERGLNFVWFVEKHARALREG